MSITKKEVLDNLEQVKAYIQEAENKKEEKVLGIAIKNRWTGDIIFQSTKTTYQEAIQEKGDKNLYGANLCGADLCEADLRGADLYEADLMNVKFYGKCGTKKLTKDQVPVFFKALGFEIEE
jgi:uncharacterized protein YjbI with pentapeptide repeats